MKNKKITRKISQGMYILTTVGGGCVVDAVSQVSAGDEPLISVAVMKGNYTNELVKKNRKLAISVLGMNVDMELVKTFGFNSMRDIDKFEDTEYEVIDSIENETHTLFICKMVDGDVFDNETEPMTYGYYQAHKDELLKVKTEEGKTAWVCNLCGYVYYGEELPEDYVCPVCSAGREYFSKK